MSLNPGYAASHLVDNYPWTELGNGTIVDVGGSQGAYSIPIVQKFPELSCVVQDLPNVVSGAGKSVPSELTEKVKFMDHDFFQEQPVKNADAYLLRHVLHDWSDKYAILILRALVPALKKGARVIINELILPEPGKIPMTEERNLR